MDYLSKLNTRQREAVTSTEGRIRVVAGAGTGKTKALTCRYAYLVNEIGIDPANILCLTFTNKAAAEMRQRISAMVQSGAYNDFVCTIDGFCVKLLRREIYRLGFPKNFRILDEDDAKSVAKECMDELGLKRTEKTVKNFLAGVSSSKSMNDYIPTYMVPGAVVSDEMKKSELACFISRQLKDYALDFDDIENFTKYILDRFPDAREYWQNQLNYIMVDEAQDCNTDNWEIIEKLAEFHKNLFIVGDPDQCIYEWRGAKPHRFVDFAADKTIILDENYRSTPNILDVANCVIANNVNRIPKNLFTLRPDGVKVTHFHGKTEKEEAEWIANQIVRRIEGRDGAAPARPADFAILYRSSYLSRPVEQALMSAKIPYSVWGGVRFFERKEVKDALSYLRVIADPNDDLSFRRIVNVPARGLGKKFMSNLEAAAKTGSVNAVERSLFTALTETPALAGIKGASEFLALIEMWRKLAEERSISDLMNIILDKSGLKKMLREDQDEDRLENVDELVKSIRFYEESHGGLEIKLSDYLQDIALYSNADFRKESAVVRLMTIHQAKGLEFPYVFVTGLSEGIFPSMRTIREFKKNGEEEERRLMYVAITRAESELFLTESEGFNVSTKMNKYPSRFLTEIRRSMFVTEGVMPEYLWGRTKNMIHVLDQENFRPEMAFQDIGNGIGSGAQTGFGGSGGDFGDVNDGFAADRAIYENPYRIGVQVSHKIFGIGEIIDVSKDGGTFQVKFPDGSIRFLRQAFLSIV